MWISIGLLIWVLDCVSKIWKYKLLFQREMTAFILFLSPELWIFPGVLWLNRIRARTSWQMREWILWGDSEQPLSAVAEGPRAWVLEWLGTPFCFNRMAFTKAQLVREAGMTPALVLDARWSCSTKILPATHTYSSRPSSSTTSPRKPPWIPQLSFCLLIPIEHWPPSIAYSKVLVILLVII